MNKHINFDAFIIIDMWEPDPNSPNFLVDYKFMNHFHQEMSKGRLPRAQLRIFTSRDDSIDPLLWAVTKDPLIAMKNPTLNVLEYHNIVKSRQDKICIVGQHYGACLLYANCGMLDFLISGYENVYTDINLVNPKPNVPFGIEEFIETFNSNPHKLRGTIKFKRVHGSIHKITLEEIYENTNSRQ